MLTTHEKAYANPVAVQLFSARVESNPFVQALVVLCLAAVVAAQLR